MIEGLHADVSATELKTRLLDRAAYHEEKAIFYADKAKGLDTTGHSHDPERDLRERASSHKTNALELRFLADHLAEGETYRLARSDLHILGLADRSY